MGDTYRYEGRARDAETLLRNVYETMRRVLGEEDMATLSAGNNLALVIRDLHRYPDAEALFRDVADKMARTQGRDDRETLNTGNNLANVLLLEGKANEAENLLVEILATSRRVVGEEVYLTLVIRKTLAVSNESALDYERLGRTAIAEDTDRQTVRAVGSDRSALSLAACAEATFRLACLRARAGDRSGTLEWLEAYAETGLAVPERITQSADLRNLRGPELDSIVARAHGR